MVGIHKNLFKLSFYSASLYNITKNVKSIYCTLNENIEEISLIFVFFENPNDNDKQCSYDIASTIIGDFPEISDINVFFYTENEFEEKEIYLLLFALAEDSQPDFE